MHLEFPKVEPEESLEIYPKEAETSDLKAIMFNFGGAKGAISEVGIQEFN